METVELSPMHRSYSWGEATVIGFMPMLLVMIITPEFIHSWSDSTLISLYIFTLIVSIFSIICLRSLETSVALVTSCPPTVEITRVSFGRFISKKQKTLKDAIWTQVEYADEMLLAVKVGTREHKTITVMFVPYSKENIPVAEKICERVASALHLRNKGYIP